LEPGIVKIEGPDGKKTFATGEGFTEVSDNKVSILVERAFDSSDLDKTSLEDEIAELRRKLKDAGKQEMEEIRLQIKELDIRLKAVIRTES
ncbi:MAG: F0F1 ATP synthase subunit epsilon, partial [Bacteroidota bacterium]